MHLDFVKLVDPYKTKALESLKKLISFNSVDDETTQTKQKPFGERVYNALDYIAKLGEELGFKVDRCENYCTELSYGEGKIVDIYAHADVVPVSKTWKTDPFELVIDGDYMYGRGAADDKGPGISALYAAKALLDNKLIDGYKLRIIFGGNEEKGSRCLEHYFHSLKKEYPTYGFTPDADFPLIYGEKSVSFYEAKYKINLNGVTKFDFGSASNIVLDKCKINCFLDKDIIAKKVKKYQKKHPEITIKYDDYEIEFIGKPSHGAHPWEGVNAGLHMLNFIGMVSKNNVLQKIYNDYFDGRGKNFKGDYSSEFFTESSYCIGLMKYCDGVLTLYVNMRLPENVDPEVACENIKKTTKCDELNLLSKGEALIQKPDSFLVRTLHDVYVKHTNDTQSKILAIGGGTYAKETKNTIAFGPTFPNRNYHIHDDDEYFLKSDFEKCMEIYAEAIYRLGEGAKNEK